MVDYVSYLGGPIYHTEQARYNAALSWYRVVKNVSLASPEVLVRLARFIRYGVINENEASAFITGRLNWFKRKKFLVALNLVDEGFVTEDWLYFVEFESIWHVKSPKVESITLFP